MFGRRRYGHRRGYGRRGRGGDVYAWIMLLQLAGKVRAIQDKHRVAVTLGLLAANLGIFLFIQGGAAALGLGGLGGGLDALLGGLLPADAGAVCLRPDYILDALAHGALGAVATRVVLPAFYHGSTWHARPTGPSLAEPTLLPPRTCDTTRCNAHS